MKSKLALGLVLITVAAAARGANPVSITAMEGGGAVSLAPDPSVVISQFRQFARTDVGAILLASEPSLRFLVNLDPPSKNHQDVVALMELSAQARGQLAAAVEPLASREQQAQAAQTLRQAYHGENGRKKITNALQDFASRFIKSVAAGRVTVEKLSSIAAELAPFEALPEVAKKVRTIQEMAQSARSAKTMDAAQRLAAQLLGGTEWAPVALRIPGAGNGSGGRPSGDDPLETAKFLSFQLQGSLGIPGKMGVVDALQSMAKTTAREGVRRYIVRELVAELKPRASNDNFNLSIITALTAIAACITPGTQEESVIHDTIILGIMEYVPQARMASHRQTALGAAARIARASSNGGVKFLARRLLQNEASAAADEAYKDFIKELLRDIFTTPKQTAAKAGLPPPAAGRFSAAGAWNFILLVAALIGLVLGVLPAN